MLVKIINGINIEVGHTIDQYKEVYGRKYDNGELWDFASTDFTNGAIEPRKDIIYWSIVVDNELRFFETDERV